MNYIDLIKDEIELYRKLLKQNNAILDNLNSESFNTTFIQNKINNKNKLLENIKQIDKTLNNIWDNWEKYKNNFSKNEKHEIKKLKKLIEENLNIESIILKKMEEFLEKHKHKALKVSLGKAALSAYKGLGSKSAYFINKTS